MGIKDIPPLSLQPQLGVCCKFIKFIKSGILSTLHLLPLCFSQWNLFKMQLPSSHHSMGTFSSSQHVSQAVFNLISLWSTFPPHSIFTVRYCIPHTSGLCIIFASLSACYLVCFAPSSLLGYLLFQFANGLLGKTCLKTQTHLGASNVYYLLVPHLFVKHSIF